MNKAEQMGVSRIRSSGRSVRTVLSSEVIQAMRDVVSSGSYGVINGVAVDVFGASVVVTIYDAVSEANKQKLSAMPVQRMLSAAHQTMRKVNEAHGR